MHRDRRAASHVSAVGSAASGAQASASAAPRPTRPELATNPGCPRSRKRSTSGSSLWASCAAVGAGAARRRAIENMVAERSSRYSGSISSLSPSTSWRSSTACWASGAVPSASRPPAAAGTTTPGPGTAAPPRSRVRPSGPCPGSMRCTESGSTSQCSRGCRVASKYQRGAPEASATVHPSPQGSGVSIRSWLNSENILASTSRCSARAVSRSRPGARVGCGAVRRVSSVGCCR